MARVFSFSLALFLSMAMVLSPGVAEAKKFGGGKSFGKSYSQLKQTPKAAPAQQTPKQATPAAAGAGKKAGMMGLLGGLLAGGLLASLFMNGAFEGIQFMDILIIGGIIFLAFYLLRRRQQGQPASAAAGGSQANVPHEPQAYQGQQMGSAAVAPEQEESGEAHQLPPDFNLAAFLEEAKQHFETLQSAWDRKDYNEIQSYVSPELFAQLKAEREAIAEQVPTQVISCHTELVRSEYDGKTASLSIRFSGWIKEDKDDTGDYNEIWHLERDISTQGPWVIVGIQQVS